MKILCDRCWIRTVHSIVPIKLITTPRFKTLKPLNENKRFTFCKHNQGMNWKTLGFGSHQPQNLLKLFSYCDNHILLNLPHTYKQLFQIIGFFFFMICFSKFNNIAMAKQVLNGCHGETHDWKCWNLTRVKCFYLIQGIMVSFK
jgi:hypothetical protein